jgi:hypothetical protein
MHQVETRVLECGLSSQKVCDTLERLLQGEPMEPWQMDKRYKSWVLAPVFPDLVNQPQDEDPEGSIWDKKDNLFSGELTSPKHEVGADILWKLVSLDLIERSPRLEDLDFYLSEEDKRNQSWDRAGFAVFAWKDAVLSRREPHNILVPGLVYVGGKVKRKWKTLQDIGGLKFKILLKR